MAKFTLSVECKSELDAILFTAWLLNALEWAETLETLKKSGDLWDGKNCVGTCEHALLECLERAQLILLLNVPYKNHLYKNNELIELKLACGRMVLYDAVIEQICHEFL